jgi:hypothetical protein
MGAAPVLRTPREAREYLVDLVCRRLLDDVHAPWSSVIREYEDDTNYLVLAIVKSEDNKRPVLSVEFGVQDADARRVCAFLLAGWNADNSDMAELRTIQIERSHNDLVTFTVRLRQYLDLPESLFDVVALAA